MGFIEHAQQIREHIIQLRRDFHRHPELAFQEERTSRKVQEELARLSIPFQVLDDHCVVGTILGGGAGKGSKTLAIRADMDALPIQEEAEVPFRSLLEGVMHACGHDGHTAMLLGTAALLKKTQPHLQGTVKLCFQSAEEVVGGAPIIVKHLKSQGGVDQAIAAHLWAELDSGRLSAQPGVRMASVDYFLLKVEGRGGHGARPDLSVDPIKPLCQAVLNISAIPATLATPLEPCLVHVGRIEGGTVANVFPQSAMAHGGIRAFSEATRDKVMALIPDIAQAAAGAWGATARVKYIAGAPMVRNDPEAVALAQEVLGETGLFAAGGLDPLTASENFGLFLQAFGGFMCFIGIRNPKKGLTYAHHHPKFGIDEDVLHKGAAFFASYAQAYLRHKTNKKHPSGDLA